MYFLSKGQENKTTLESVTPNLMTEDTRTGRLLWVSKDQDLSWMQEKYPTASRDNDPITTIVRSMIVSYGKTSYGILVPWTLSNNIHQIPVVKKGGSEFYIDGIQVNTSERNVWPLIESFLRGYFFGYDPNRISAGLLHPCVNAGEIFNRNAFIEGKASLGQVLAPLDIVAEGGQIYSDPKIKPDFRLELE
jgi:hypothetical protein